MKMVVFDFIMRITRPNDPLIPLPLKSTSSYLSPLRSIAHYCGRARYQPHRARVAQLNCFSDAIVAIVAIASEETKYGGTLRV